MPRTGALRKQHKLPGARTTHCLDCRGRTEMESHKSDPWDWVSGKQCVPTASQAFITQDVFQYVQSHSEKNWLRYWALKGIFWVHLLIISVHCTQDGSTSSPHPIVKCQLYLGNPPHQTLTATWMHLTRPWGQKSETRDFRKPSPTY